MMAKDVILEKEVKLENGKVLKKGRHFLLNSIAEPLLKDGKAVLTEKKRRKKNVEPFNNDKK